MAGRLEVRDLGAAVDYAVATAIQAQCHADRRAGRIADTLLLLEHAPVFTLGRSAQADHVRWSASQLLTAGITLVSATRGGDVTYHGPGQLVGYPIIHLGSRGMGVLDYVTAIEETMIRALDGLGLPGAGRDARNRGVWVGNDKICAFGVHVRQRVAIHGFALNVSTDLASFRHIVPCGLSGAGLTSVARLRGRAPDLAALSERLAAAIARSFGLAMVRTSATSARLGIANASP